jgi:hypothetical protein
VQAMSWIFNTKIKFKKIFIINCHSGKFTPWFIVQIEGYKSKS